MDDQEKEKKMDSLERLEGVCACIVLTGVALEYVLKLLPYHIPADLIGTALIVGGIAGEIYFGHRVARIQKDLRMKLQHQIAMGQFGAW
jgi:hypothetical protein